MMEKKWTGPLTIATRGSRLALAQAELVKKALEKVVPDVRILKVTTKGDRDKVSELVKIGGDGLFVRGVEKAILEGKADLAVHCGKDLPFEISEGLVIAGVPAAADARDVLVMTDQAAQNGPKRIGTGSPRRVTELKRFYPDAEMVSIRGNITTRLERLRDGTCDGLILAKAGIDRLGLDLSEFRTRLFDPSQMIPAACQGILALECKEDDYELVQLLHSLSDPETEERFRIERNIFQRLRADCTKPLGIHAELCGDSISLYLCLNGRRVHLKAKRGEEDRITEEAARALLGHVTLVGAGCGRGLITEAGMKAIRKADVLIYDALMDDALISGTKKDCEKVYVGKRAGAHCSSQDEINRILIEKASGGREVVRLKGGDSFVFGRGGEEIMALQNAGVSCSIIPGVTSSVAVPESFGIPVTERGIARSFTVITGHTAVGSPEGEDEEDYDALAHLRGTLVFLMAKGSLARISERLIEEGKNPETPAAVLSCGFTASASRIDGTLADIAQRAADAPTPAIFVVGKTAGFHLPVGEPDEAGVLASEEMSMTREDVTIAGTPHIVGKMTDALKKRGISSISGVSLMPVPVPQEMPDAFPNGSWVVFTSANGVDVYFDELKKRKTDLRVFGGVHFAVIGDGTEEALSSHGFHADFIPSEFTGRCLGRELAERIRSDHKKNANEGTKLPAVILIRADKASKALTDELAHAGLLCEDYSAYTLRPLDPDGGMHGWDETNPYRKEACRTKKVVFLSALGAKAYLMFHEIPEETTIYAIGPVTAKKVSEMTGRTCLMPEHYSTDDLAERIAADLK